MQALQENGTFPSHWNLTTAPVELLIIILTALDFRSLLTCRQLCHLLNDVIENTPTLQYIIELAAAGMQDGSHSPLPPTARLERLKKHQESWNTLTWTRDENIEAVRGVVWELYGGVFAQHRRRNDTLMFWQLPSVHRNIEKRQWSIPISDIHVRDFGMDDAQDLLVLIESQMLAPTSAACRVHLRTLSTGEPHPLAPNPAVISHALYTRHFPLSYELQISADFIGILLKHGNSNEFLVWDWKTGCIKSRVVGKQMRSFAFLTEKHAILASLADEGPTLGIIDCEKFPEGIVDTDTEKFLCLLCLPELARTAHPIDITIRSDPGPLWTPSRRLQVPFSTANNNRLYVVTLWIRRYGVYSVTVCVPSSTLLPHISTASDGMHNYPWEDWGPSGTRLLSDFQNSSVWVCYVFGSKFVTCRRMDDGHVTIEVYDFNQLACRRILQKDCQRHAGTKVFTAETIEGSGLFGSDVTTCLPYRKRTLCLKTRPGEIDAVMCSEDNLVIVAPPETVHPFRMLTF